MPRILPLVAAVAAFSLTLPVSAQQAAEATQASEVEKVVQPPPPPPKPKSLEELLELVAKGWREERTENKQREAELRLDTELDAKADRDVRFRRETPI